MKKWVMRIVSLALSFITIMSAAGVQIFAKETGLNATTLYLNVGGFGESYCLILEDYSGKVSWSSSDNNVVTIKANGCKCVVRGVTHGTAVVTAKTSKGSYKCTVKVTGNISIGERSINVYLNDSTTYTCTVNGSKNILIKNKNEDVFSVTNKKLKGNKLSFTVNGLKEGHGVIGIYFKEDESICQFLDVKVSQKTEPKDEPVVVLSKDCQQLKDGDTLEVSEVNDKKKSVKNRKIKFITTSPTGGGLIYFVLPGAESYSDPGFEKKCTYKAYVYDTKKKKYCLRKEGEYEYWSGKGDLGCGIKGVRVPDYKKYSLVIRYYFDGDLVYQDTGKSYPDPIIKYSNDGKTCKIKLFAPPSCYDGVEIYTYDDELCESAFYDANCESVPITEKTKKEYPSLKLVYRNSTKDPAGRTVEISGKKAKYFAVRYFKKVNGKKTYTDCFSDTTTHSLQTLINGVKLDPQEVTSGEELKLVKEFVNKYITDDMTNEEKFLTLVNELEKRGKYQFDINKIDGNRPVWQLLVKGEGQCATWAFTTYDVLKYVGFDVRVVRGISNNGNQHFWCQLKLCGNLYNVDTHLNSVSVEPITTEIYSGYVPQEYFG